MAFRWKPRWRRFALAQVGTRTPTGYVVASAFDKLAVWAAGGKPPPSAPHLNITQVNQRPAQSVVARNADGWRKAASSFRNWRCPPRSISASASRLIGSGPAREAIGAGACVRWGYSTDMTVAQLNAHYPSHAAYVAEVKKVADENFKKGYILPFDAAATIREAEDSRVGQR